MQLQLIGCLIELSQKTGQYVPFLQYLHPILMSSQFTKKKIKVSSKPFDFALGRPMEKKFEKSSGYWNQLFTICMELATLGLALYSRDIGFPEYSYGFTKFLKTLMKRVSFSGYKIQIKALLALIAKDVAVIVEQRTGLDLAPANLLQLGKFKSKPVHL